MRFQFDFNTISKLLGSASNEAGRFDRGRKGGSVGFGTGSVGWDFMKSSQGIVKPTFPAPDLAIQWEQLSRICFNVKYPIERTQYLGFAG